VIDSRSRWPRNGLFCSGQHERRARIGPHLTENRNPVDFRAILERRSNVPPPPVFPFTAFSAYLYLRDRGAADAHRDHLRRDIGAAQGGAMRFGTMKFCRPKRQRLNGSIHAHQ